MIHNFLSAASDLARNGYFQIAVCIVAVAAFPAALLWIIGGAL